MESPDAFVDRAARVARDAFYRFEQKVAPSDNWRDVARAVLAEGRQVTGADVQAAERHWLDNGHPDAPAADRVEIDV